MRPWPRLAAFFLAGIAGHSGTLADRYLMTALPVQPENIPAELRERPQWVAWRTESRAGKATKLPYQVNGRLAKSDDPKTWSQYEAALAAYLAGGFAGVGFVFTADDSFIGSDLDGCRDQATGAIEEWAKEIIDRCASYAEVSPSGTGVKIFGRGVLPGGRGKRHDLGDGRRIELYDRGRYFATTGHALPGSPPTLNDCQATIDDIWQRYFAMPIGQHVGLPIVATDAVERCRRYVAKMPPAISGQGGHGQTFNVACELYRFGLSDTDAAALLAEYNGRCLPPWSENELAHKLQDARKEVESKGEFGSRLRDQFLVPITAREIEPAEKPPAELPAEMFRVPGFVGELSDHCLKTAPYPSPALAFCGALAMQSFLAARKVRDPADNRSNIYVCGLAYPGVGKDWPRKLNAKISVAIGLSDSLGDRFASGEGLQDAMAITPAMLYQSDEFDGFLQSIAKARDNRFENIMGTLLTMFSASNSVFPIRRRAGQQAGGFIDQPSLTIFGTAVPTHWNAALSERLLTNGLVARLIIVEAGKRGAGQEPSLVDVPSRILETAAWWAAQRPGTGNFEKWHPVPDVVEYSSAARDLLADSRADCDGEYSKAEAAGDAVATTIWGRAQEHIRKLALLHAVSADHRSPTIDTAAVQWATDFVMGQTKRLLFAAKSHVADSPFHADCLRFMGKLRESPDMVLGHSDLLRKMKMDAASFGRIVSTLSATGDIVIVPVRTAGRDGVAYALAT